VKQACSGAQLSLYAVQVYKQSVYAVQVYKQSVHDVQVYTPQRDDWHKDNIMQQLERKGNWDQLFSRKTATHWGVKKRDTLLNRRCVYMNSQNVNQYNTKTNSNTSWCSAKQTIQLSLICYQANFFVFTMQATRFALQEIIIMLFLQKSTSEVTNNRTSLHILLLKFCELSRHKTVSLSCHCHVLSCRMAVRV
jgi:hypothetical protein